MKVLKFFSLILVLAGPISADTIQDIAEKKKLYHNIQWIKLLHYKQLGVQFSSRSGNSKGFFFSPRGAVDPRAEIYATLENFTQSTLIGDNHPACRFPARYKWLKKEIGTDLPSFDFNQCAKLNNYTRELAVKSISMVFVSAMMQIPASMFGHTFLKLNREDPARGTLQDFTVSFVGDVDASNMFDYAFKGMTGGFSGILDFQNFDFRTKFYNYHEDRSIWEFKLKLSPEELERFTDHLWEIRSADIKYYFMSENCAFYNAYFIEVAKPGLKILQNKDVFVYPAETVKNLVNNEGILQTAFYYPANILNFSGGYDLLLPENQFLLENWPAKNFAIPGDKTQAGIFLNTIRYKGYIKGYDKNLELKPENQVVVNEAERMLSGNQVNAETFAVPDFTNPSVGHRPFMVSAMFGIDPDYYLDLIIRPTFHDKYDSPLGYPLYSEITALKTAIRLNFTNNEFYLKKIDLINILSVTPVISDLFKFSMRFSGWIERLSIASPGLDDNNKYLFNFDNGYGISARIPFIKNEFLIYLFANYTINASAGFHKGYRITPYAEGGLFWYPVDWVTVYANTRFGYFFPYETFMWDSEFALNVLINSNLSIMGILNYNFLDNIVLYQFGTRIYL